MAEENGKKEKSKFKFNQLFTTIIVVLAVFFAAVFAATIFFIKVVLPQRSEYMMLSEANQVKYMVPLGEDLVVNLADPSGRRFIRVNLTLVTDTEETQAEILRRKPQIRDVVIKIFRTKTVDKIREEEGILNIRNEIITAITDMLPFGQVIDVFFTEFVYQ
ncbi:MAG TPA: flagellar basal body-associated FliL family protein [Firmicutes bacterium]|nr:flagellar basal body-associated FliL family protein [Bacillota bacterium]